MQFEVEGLQSSKQEIAFGSPLSKYVQAAMANIEEYLAKSFNGRKLPKKHVKSPFATNCYLGLDLSPELDEKLKLMGNLTENWQ